MAFEILAASILTETLSPLENFQGFPFDWNLGAIFVKVVGAASLVEGQRSKAFPQAADWSVKKAVNMERTEIRTASTRRSLEIFTEFLSRIGGRDFNTLLPQLHPNFPIFNKGRIGREEKVILIETGPGTDVHPIAVGRAKDGIARAVVGIQSDILVGAINTGRQNLVPPSMQQKGQGS